MNSVELEYPSLFRRFIASILDGIFIFTIYIIILFIITTIFGMEIFVNTKIISVIIYWTYILIYISYNHIFYLISWQATPGKRIMGMYIIRENAPIDILTTIKRNIIAISFLIMGIFSFNNDIMSFKDFKYNINIAPQKTGIIEVNTKDVSDTTRKTIELSSELISIIFNILGITNILIILFNKKRKALHDYIADTIVIKGRL